MLSVVVFKWEPLANQLESIPTQVGPTKVDYGKNHVNTHYNMIRRNLSIPFRYVLFTDQRDYTINENVIQLDLWDRFRELGGCYHRLYTFSNQMKAMVGDRFVCMDLDMIITGDITALLTREEDFIYYRMKGSDGNGWRMNNGMYMMNAGAREHIWEEFKNAPDASMGKRVGPGTDQGWTNYWIQEQHPNRAIVDAYWEQGSDGIYDMRQDIIEKNRTDLPENCKILMWPGPRDPQQEKFRKKYKFIEKYYN